MSESKGRFVVVSGDKGGVGKSLMSTLLTDYAIHTINAPALALIEGDPQLDDVAARFQSKRETGHLVIVTVDLASDAEAARKSQSLGIHIEQLVTAADDDQQLLLILNSPASLSSTIDDSAPDFRAICDVLGLEMVAVWMVGRDKSSVDTAKRSELLRHAHRRVAVINAEEPRETAWHIYEASREWQGQQFELRQLKGVVVSSLKGFHSRSFREAAGGAAGENGHPLSLIERANLRRWIESVDCICRHVLEPDQPTCG